jgi:hypothetical protein
MRVEGEVSRRVTWRRRPSRRARKRASRGRSRRVRSTCSRRAGRGGAGSLSGRSGENRPRRRIRHHLNEPRLRAEPASPRAKLVAEQRDRSRERPRRGPGEAWIRRGRPGPLSTPLPGENSCRARGPDLSTADPKPIPPASPALSRPCQGRACPLREPELSPGPRFAGGRARTSIAARPRRRTRGEREATASRDRTRRHRWSCWTKPWIVARKRSSAFNCLVICSTA